MFWPVALVMLACGACRLDSPPDTRSIARGAESYRASGCAACHGPSGRGDGPAGKATQRAPRDFTRPETFTAPRTVSGIAGVIRDGDRGGGMPPNPDLTEAERKDLATYILSLGDAQAKEGSSG